MKMNPEDKLLKLGILLPQPPQPKGSYTSCTRAGNLVYVSGQGPAIEGIPKYVGKVGQDLTQEEGYESARICGINLLAQLKSYLGTLDKIIKIVNLRGYVNSAVDFYGQSAVIDGASDLMKSIFGEETGIHSRCAIGVSNLPGNISTEIEMIAEVAD